jgi:hypothetical protein
VGWPQLVLGKFNEEKIMYKFKVGDLVLVRCAGSSVRANIKSVDSNGNYLVTNRPLGCGCQWFYENELTLSTCSLDNLAIDDVVIDDCGCEFTVVDVHGKVVDIADENGHYTNSYTVKELKDDDFTVKPAEEDVLELTVAEISEKYGKTVKVVDK